MPLDPRDLATCRDLLSAGSKTFSAAARFLPNRMRDDTTVVYAFCRIADDAIDADPNATEATVELLRARLHAVYRGEPDDHAVDRALSHVVREKRLPLPLFEALLEGLAWDARGRRYETLEDLYAYAARVAAAVGAIMTVLMGPREASVLARACDLGVAMQLTNIARDVGEDAHNGRVYLPLAWLRDEGIAVDAWVARPVTSDALARVTKRLLDSADALYRRADEGIGSLPGDCRVAIRAARLIYAAIGDRVRASGYDSITTRAFVPTWRKVWLLLRAFGARFWRAPSRQDPTRTLAFAPPLGPTRFLVAAVEESP